MASGLPRRLDQIELFKEFGDAPAPLAFAQVAQVRHEAQVLLAGEQLVDGRELAGDPIAARTALGSRATSWPATRASPPSAPSSVDRIWTVVVLPAPLGPSRAKTFLREHGGRCPRARPFLPYDLRRPVTVIADGGPFGGWALIASCSFPDGARLRRAVDRNVAIRGASAHFDGFARLTWAVVRG